MSGDSTETAADVDQRLAEELDAIALAVGNGPASRFHSGPLADAGRRLFEALGAALRAPA